MVLFLKLILTNLLRHRVRTLIGVAGIAFSVAAMLAVVTILQGAVGMFQRILSSDSELIVFERDVSDLFFSNVPVEDIRQMNEWPTVQSANPVLFGIVSSPGHPIITCFGVTPQDARLVKAEWQAGRRDDFGKDPRGVALGARAAEFLHASTGSQVAIGHETFPVAGILKTANGFEDGGVFMPLAAAEQFFHKEGVVSVATVKLKNKDDRTAFKQAVEEKFPQLIALENSEFSRSYSQFKILKATAWAVGLCGLILGGLGVANTMIMSVFTRIREIAILRVNGFSRKQIAALIFGESALVSLAGAVAGLLLGTACIWILKSVPDLNGYIDGRWQPAVALVVTVLGGVTGIAGALYPAFYAVRIRAVDALRFE
jgi:putative ABC transport system permease protein